MPPLELCQCLQCLKNSTKHHITGEAVNGLYLPKSTVALHKNRRRDEERTFHPASSFAASVAPKNKDHSGATAMTTLTGKSNITTQAGSHAASTPLVEDPQINQILREFNESIATFKSVFTGIAFSPDLSIPLPANPPPLHVGLNEVYLLHLDHIGRIRNKVSTISNHVGVPFLNNKCAFALQEVQTYEHSLHALVGKSWHEFVDEYRKSQNTGLAADSRIDCEQHFVAQRRLASFPATILSSYITITILYLLAGLPRNYANLLLGAMKLAITVACHQYLGHYLGGSCPSPMPDPIKTLGNGEKWHSDVRTALETLHLDPNLVEFACCKKCFSCYGKVDGKYPTTCNFRETPGETSLVCGTQLTVDGDFDDPAPIQTFAYQPMTSFLARLLSRPGIHQQMEKNVQRWNQPQGHCSDIFGAEALRTFLGPDKATPYLEVPAGEVRLVFSLFVDWFNPYGNKASGKSVSVGGIYMLLLNLPIHLRYQIDNVYIVGVMPREPGLHHINHILCPLVSDLLVLWEKGVWFSKTAFHNSGCLVRSAVVPLVADAPAARKTSGFAGVRSRRFCTFCTQTYSELSNYDVKSWTPVQRSVHMKNALSWKNAPNENERDRLWNEHQVRWSELLRLPYWDPTKFVVVDPMHNLFLNLVSHHVRDLWGIHDSKTNGRKGVLPHSTDQQAANIDIVYSALVRKDLRPLLSVRRTYLELFIDKNNITLTSEQKSSIPKLAGALLSWWSSRPGGVVLIKPTPHSEPTVDLLDAKAPQYVLDRLVVEEIRKDMERTILPGWIGRPPRNFGSKAHGKLSADHWRVSFTVSLVITLVRLWGQANANQRNKIFLDNFMALVAVIRHATARITSEKHIHVVELQLQNYYKTLAHVSTKRYPSHHHSLHIPECLRRFGPAHGWWSYPYERYNGIMQRLNHNNHPSQLPTTFTRSFCQGANLKAILASDALPPSFGAEFKVLLDKFVKKDFKGALLSDFASSEATETPTEPPVWDGHDKGNFLDSDQYSALGKRLNKVIGGFKFTTSQELAANGVKLLNPRIQDRKMIGANGVVFATAKFSLGNSLITFRPGDGTQPRAAQIQRIFLHSRPLMHGQNTLEFFYVIREFAPLTDQEANQDPYRKFPLVDVKLYRDELSLDPIVIRTADIVSHFASSPSQLTGHSSKYRVVLSLDRELRDI